MFTSGLSGQAAHQLVADQRPCIRAFAQILDVAGQMVNQVLLCQQQVAMRVVEDIEQMALPSGVHPLPIAP